MMIFFGIKFQYLEIFKNILKGKFFLHEVATNNLKEGG